MKHYHIREGLVCRDIADIYFVIDIHDKHFYRNKEVNCVNAIAYQIILCMQRLQSFSVVDIRQELLKLINDTTVSHEQIDKDINDFILMLKNKGWVL